MTRITGRKEWEERKEKEDRCMKTVLGQSGRKDVCLLFLSVPVL